ncbi:hypothetical protein GN958_ATG16653 [Phytophthora infestans]|uniref:Capsid protein n=1 Tax=Phytophthora infestans TaxID=4787 RepID=A0A8S9U7L2_PHYIN|nr:hypothetical protein GN958_ATG16653 [Phytophthora infestans]
MSEASNKRARIEDGMEDEVDEIRAGLQVTKIHRPPSHVYNNNYTVRLTYADNYMKTMAYSGGNANHIWRMSSIFDPDYTTTGHQPIGRDLWASMYDYYTVIRCDYKIRMYNAQGRDPVTWGAVGSSAQAIGAVNATFLASTNDTDISNATFVYPQAEMKNTHTKFLTPLGYTDFTGSLTQGDFIVDAKDADQDTTWTANGANPAVPRYFGVSFTSAAPTLVSISETLHTAVQMQVILEYTVQFTQVNPALRQAAS